MITSLRDLLKRMQSQATGCVAVLLLDLRDGTVMESCGDEETTSAGGVAGVMRDLFTPQHVFLPRIPAPGGERVAKEVILLSDEATYVCRRLESRPHHAVTAICRNMRNLGLVVSVLHEEIAIEDGT